MMAILYISYKMLFLCLFLCFTISLDFYVNYKSNVFLYMLKNKGVLKVLNSDAIE